jgi:hypothetical protein
VDKLFSLVLVCFLKQQPCLFARDKGSSLFLFVPVKPFQPKLVLVIMLSVIMLSVIMLSVILLNVIMLNVIMLSVC